MITFDEFIKKVDELYETNKTNYVYSLRYGQALMNVLYDAWKEKYQEIAHTKLDCFYRDDIVDQTVSKLRQDWAL